MQLPAIRQPYKLLQKYDGMGPNDEVIWDSFIMANPSAFDFVYYNVHIGRPTDDPVIEQTMRRNGSWEVSQWCVDVLAFASGKPYVIEVKPNAGAGALGQALSYTRLLQAEGFIGEDAQPIVVTDNLSPITEQAALQLGVIVAVP